MTDAVPWVKWHFDKWRGDNGLRACGLAARGLWADLLAIMHGATPYGYLAINGRAPTAKQIASLVGMTTHKEVSRLLEELEGAGVFSRSSDNNLIYCRRMVRDGETRTREAILGAEGRHGGNPNLARGTLPKELRTRPFKRSDSPEKTDRIFEKSSGCCHWCGKKLQRKTAGHDFFQVDHVTAIRDGGGNEEENLVAACARCNHARARVDWIPPGGGLGSVENPTPTNEKPTATLEKEEEKEEERESPPYNPPPSTRAKPRIQVPSDWKPNADGVSYAKERGLKPPDLAAFVDFHRSKGNVFSDIDAAWRTWCRNAVKFGTVAGPALPELPLDTAATAANPTGRPLSSMSGMP